MRLSRKTRCTATTKKGKQCTAPAVAGTKFCFFHTGDNAVQVGARGGGRRNLIVSRDGETAPTHFEPPKTVEEQAAILAQLQAQVHKGQCPTRVAATIATLANSFLGALEMIEFGKKLKELEARLGVDSALDRLEEERVQ